MWVLRVSQEPCTQGSGPPAEHQDRLSTAVGGHGYCRAFSRVTSRQYLHSCGSRLFHQVDGAYAIPDQEATTVARKLTDEFFFRFSPPEQLHSYQGHNFESAVISEVCKLLGVVKTRTTAYHPQSDGLVERFNRTLLSMLATAAVERPFDWESQLRRLCLAYNTSIHPTTGETPFLLMFGRQVRMPVDVMYGTPTPQPSTVPQYVADLRLNLEAAYQRVRDHMGRKLDRQKEVYDRKAHGEPFEPGDLVWLHTSAVPRGRSKKLHCP